MSDNPSSGDMFGYSMDGGYQYIVLDQRKRCWCSLYNTVKFKFFEKKQRIVLMIYKSETTGKNISFDGNSE